MATLETNIDRVIGVIDRAVGNIEAKGVSVPANITAEEQMDKILEISGGGGGDGQIETWLTTNGYTNQADRILWLLELNQNINRDSATTWTLYSTTLTESRVVPMFIDPVNPITPASIAGKSHIMYIGGNITTTGITSTKLWFRYLANLTEFNVPNWPAATSAEGMLQFNYSLQDITLNLPVCTNINSMLYRCESLLWADLTLPTTGTSMVEAFQNCFMLKKITFNGGGDGMVKCTDATRTFRDANQLEEVDGIINVNGIWSFSATFDGCTELRDIKIYGLSGNGISFQQCPNLSVDSMVYLFENAVATGSSTIWLGATNLAKLTNDQKAIATNKGYTLK